VLTATEASILANVFFSTFWRSLCVSFHRPIATRYLGVFSWAFDPYLPLCFLDSLAQIFNTAQRVTKVSAETPCQQRNSALFPSEPRYSGEALDSAEFHMKSVKTPYTFSWVAALPAALLSVENLA